MKTAPVSTVHGQHFCLVAHHADTEIIMAEDGWCMAAGLHYCRAGDTFENMITFMLTHPGDFPVLDINADAAQYLADR
jgi:hypothetical protein